MKNIKIAILAVLASAAWIADWVLIQKAIYSTQHIDFLSWASLVTVLALAFTTLFHIVNHSRINSTIVLLILLSSYVLLMPKDPYVILGGALFILLLFLFENRIRDEERGRQDFSIWRICGSSTRLIIYGLLLLLAFNVYYTIQTRFSANPDAYYEKLAVAVNKATPYITKSYPELTEEQRVIINQNIANQAVTKLKESSVGYESYVPFVFAVIVMGLLSTFAFVIRWAAVIVTWALFRLLMLIGFFRLEPVMMEVKKLVI